MVFIVKEQTLQTSLKRRGRERDIKRENDVHRDWELREKVGEIARGGGESTSTYWEKES